MDKYSKLKTYSLYTLFTLTTLFCLVWFVDILFPTFTPEYKPLLWFLEIVNDLLKTIITMG